ncbi:cytochrome b/b6 domain-containing protein [Marinobacterium weihaiense]|uniref:Cytochrome b/b6 domain-containing protein n=1 Tax=Marinobacterium weihaiense TaxID=2851016 RepID=A0ABS6MCL7_9GAMM|nr:cytochrome b/b6 domain-containing protein [Marinobacterium weihaiense]MBV0933467.1 cytochrome b/b6 domain-containing protein [Marinobacterium weihaiense]
MDAGVKVWDPGVRLFHGALALCFALSWISADRWQDLHEITGYTLAGLLLFRLVWGLCGPRYARFCQFVRPPRQVLAYLQRMRTGREARYLGHNPAGGMMVVLLLTGLALLATTGWLYTDWLWGEAWVEAAHEWLANALLVLVGLHLAGVALASWRHRENLPRAMLTGRKRSPGQSDVC